MRDIKVGEKITFKGKIVVDVNKRVGSNRNKSRRRVHIFLLKDVTINGKRVDHLWIKLTGGQNVTHGDVVKGYGYGEVYFRRDGSGDFHVAVKNIEKEEKHG